MNREINIAAHLTIHKVMLSPHFSSTPALCSMCSFNTLTNSLTVFAASSAVPFDWLSPLADTSGTTRPPWNLATAFLNASTAASWSHFNSSWFPSPPGWPHVDISSDMSLMSQSISPSWPMPFCPVAREYFSPVPSSTITMIGLTFSSSSFLLMNM